MTPPPRLTDVLHLGEVGTVAAAQAVRRHSTALAPFAELVARFGKPAVADVVTLSRTLHAPTGVLTDAALEEGWAAVRRLLEMARTVPDEAGRIRAGLDVQRSMMALLSREGDLTVTWTEAVSDAIRAGRGEAAKAALALAPALAKSAVDLAGAKVLARLSADLPGASAELRQLWAVVHQTLPQTDPGMLKAAALAAERAAAVRDLLKGTGKSAAARQSALWGHVSGVRGAFGEAHALVDAAWKGIVDEEYLRALKLAAQLGPGYDVRYFTQGVNQLLLNGREGPDAVLALVNRARHEMVDVMRGQVKIATIAESAQQNVNDLWRLIGEERAAASGMPAYYTVTVDGVEETFNAVMRPEVVPRIVLINPADSRIPGTDLDMVRQLGLLVDEVRLALSVKQYTHLTISMIESAIKNL